MFLILAILSFAGFDSSDGMDSADLDGYDSDHSFRIFSLQNLTAFFMMFGLSGMAIWKLFDGYVWLSLAGAMMIGVLAVLVIFYITGGMYALQSSGTMNIEDAIGSKGTVYLHIKEDDTGKVQISFKNRFRIMNAIAGEKEDLPDGTRVVVTGVYDGSTLIVKKDKI